MPLSKLPAMDGKYSNLYAYWGNKGLLNMGACKLLEGLDRKCIKTVTLERSSNYSIKGNNIPMHSMNLY